MKSWRKLLWVGVSVAIGVAAALLITDGSSLKRIVLVGLTVVAAAAGTVSATFTNDAGDDE